MGRRGRSVAGVVRGVGRFVLRGLAAGFAAWHSVFAYVVVGVIAAVPALIGTMIDEPVTGLRISLGLSLLLLFGNLSLHQWLKQHEEPKPLGLPRASRAAGRDGGAEFGSGGATWRLGAIEVRSHPNDVPAAEIASSIEVDLRVRRRREWERAVARTQVYAQAAGVVAALLVLGLALVSS